MRSGTAWAVFLSGRGSNAQALWENLAELDIRLVVSSRKKSLGLARARQVGLPTLVLDVKPNWENLTL
jgi:folate-dependent phosphoribosylglycinamide formyltransferase PurN